MMRKNLFIGIVLAAIVGIVAGGYLANRSGAQDAPKKGASDEKKSEGDLFEILKKELEAKKNAPGTLPPLPPPVVVTPAFPMPALPKEPMPALPKVSDTKPVELPPLSSQTIPPPTVSAPMPSLPNVSAPLPPVRSPDSLPPPPTVNEKKVDAPAVAPPLDTRNETPGYPKEAFDKLADPAKAKTEPIPPPVVNVQFPPIVPAKPQVIEPKKTELKPTPDLVFPPLPTETKVKPAISSDSPPLSKPKTDTVNPKKTDEELNKAIESFDGSGSLVPQVHSAPRSDPPIAEQVAKLKGCPWSLQVQMVNGQTVVTAAVNRKHEFKIVCKTLDLQTGKGTLKAAGIVKVTGDESSATCDELTIHLLENRFVLQGNVVISTNASGARPAALELKGESISLRIGEMPSKKLVQTSWGKVDGNVSLTQAVAASAIQDKQWSPYGKLRALKSHDNSPSRWCLENQAGKVIAYLHAREGGTLEQYVGRTISVFGTREGDDAGYPLVRVTHIALP
jgi:hypothetical protein